MIRRPPRSTRTDTRFPYTTLCRSVWEVLAELVEAGELRDILRESEAVWGQARAPWMVEVNEKDEPSASVDCHGLKHRSEEHTSELQSLMRISYAVFCLKKKIRKKLHTEEVKKGLKGKNVIEL